MVMAASSLPPTRYWVDVILTTAWQCQRFDCEREALAYAQVYARLPNAEAVVAYAYKPEGREIIFEWSEAEAKLGRRAKHGNPARRTSQ
jgi:hypothetical protein